MENIKGVPMNVVIYYMRSNRCHFLIVYTKSHQGRRRGRVYNIVEAPYMLYIVGIIWEYSPFLLFDYNTCVDILHFSLVGTIRAQRQDLLTEFGECISQII